MYICVICVCVCGAPDLPRNQFFLQGVSARRHDWPTKLVVSWDGIRDAESVPAFVVAGVLLVPFFGRCVCSLLDLVTFSEFREKPVSPLELVDLTKAYSKVKLPLLLET